MKADVKPLEKPCRHLKFGRCLNHFWQVMKEFGKPRLAAYSCILWQAKMKALTDYQDTAWRTGCFGLTGQARENVMTKVLARKPSRATSCPDFKPVSCHSPIQCRFYHMETCLLKYPLCQGRCPDYLVQGDQR